MTRAVRAVLIAAPDSALARGTFAGALPVLDALGRFLERRFAASTIARVTPAAGPVTKAAVRAGFARTRPAPGELLVVLFLGHGLPPDEAHPRAAWALAAEELTDLELAAELHRAPPGAEIIVISGCCHGRALRLPPAEDEAPAAPIVHISTGRDVLRAVAAQLVTEVIAAAEQGLSYQGLDDRFRRERFAGREFHVDAPADRMAHLVLDARVLPCAG